MSQYEADPSTVGVHLSRSLLVTMVPPPPGQSVPPAEHFPKALFRGRYEVGIDCVVSRLLTLDKRPIAAVFCSIRVTGVVLSCPNFYFIATR